MVAGQIKFGSVTQTAAAFNEISDGLSFFRNVYDQFASYRAAIIRLDGLVVADEKARELPELLVRQASTARSTSRAWKCAHPMVTS